MLGVLISVGLGVFVTANNLVGVNAAPAEHRGLATGTLETTRQFGHALAVAVVALLIGATDLKALSPETLVDGASRSYFVMAGLALLGAALSWPVKKRGI